MSSSFQRSLRRLKTGKRRGQLQPRSQSQLRFLDLNFKAAGTLLHDSTVYIDILQGRFPGYYEAVLWSADVWHSSVTEAELAVACALLDPAHPGTPSAMKEIVEIIDRRPLHRTIAPDHDIWREAGLLAGTLARLQGIHKSDQRRMLNDALIFCTARKFGHTVLTRNIRDFDLLNQLDPSGRVLFYRV